jgi:pilus assembly protein CpaF
VAGGDIDVRLVAEVARRVAERLADDRMSRRAAGQLEPSMEEEHRQAFETISEALDAMAAESLARGREHMSEEAEHLLTDAVIASVLGLGRIQPLLDDPDISDIHIRGFDSVWIKRRDGSRVSAAPVADSDEELVQLIRIAATRLARSERRFDAANPEVNLQLPDGSRMFAVMEVSSRPTVIIRRHRFELSSLDDLRRCGLLDRAVCEMLAAAVRCRRNIIIAGGTGSGKTTLLRALLNEVPSDERIVTIEDAYELGIERFAHLHPDHDALQARPANIEGQGGIGLVDLTRMALRMDPDRVIVGEVRGPEAFPMVMAMSQGNNGSMCTMHADSTRSVFPKLAAYVSMAETGLPIDSVNLLLATALHFVVHIEIIDGVRRVTSVREVVDADGATIVSNEVFRPGPDGWAIPGFPFRDSTARLFEDSGFDLSLLDEPDGWWDR